MRPDPDDFLAARHAESDADAGVAKAGDYRRTKFIAAPALAVVAVGGWMMWSAERDADNVPPATALDIESQQPIAAALSYEPQAVVPELLDAVTLSQQPPPEAPESATLSQQPRQKPPSRQP